MAPLDAFRAHVMADPARQQPLSAARTLDAFVPLAVAEAEAAGIGVMEEALRAEAQPDPLGLDRWMPAPLSGTAWPPLAWLPVRATPVDGDVAIDWAHFAGEPLDAPFFEASVREVAGRPFNRLFRYRTMLGDFVANAELAQSCAPDGLIFHMSRCGSTLVSQMLGALPDTIMVSEAGPLDAIVQFAVERADMPLGTRIAALRAMVAALGRRRKGVETRFFLKLDAWHILALPLFRQAFPSVPWIFQYRDPVEILVSQMRLRGMQTRPEAVPSRLHGIPGGGDGGEAAECARMLACFCGAAADGAGVGRLLVAYPELPDAVSSRILGHFGVAATDADCAAMAEVAQRDAKRPQEPFNEDAATKQQEVNPEIRAAAKAHLADVYRRLQAIRAASLSPSSSPRSAS